MHQLVEAPPLQPDIPQPAADERMVVAEVVADPDRGDLLDQVPVHVGEETTDRELLVSTRDVFSEQELARLRGFPEITFEELIQFFTLSSADEAFLGSMRRPATMLGVAVQLCSLPWLGFVPDDVAAAPPVAVARLAERLGVRLGSWPATGAGTRLAPITCAR